MNILVYVIAGLLIYGITTLIINSISNYKYQKIIYDRLLSIGPISQIGNFINNTSLKNDLMFLSKCVLNNIKSSGYNIDEIIKPEKQKEFDIIIGELIEKYCNHKLHLMLFIALSRENKQCSPDKILNYIKTKFPNNITVNKLEFQNILSNINIIEIENLCKVSCNEGMTVCDNTCVDLTKPNDQYCGNCDTKCDDNQTCIPFKETDDSETIFKCVNKCYDENNNFTLCKPNETCCKGVCMDLTKPNDNNCGSCGTTCVPQNVCKQFYDSNNNNNYSTCAPRFYCENDTNCGEDQICCDQTCVNIYDEQHCGNCQTICNAPDTCVSTPDGFKCISQPMT